MPGKRKSYSSKGSRKGYSKRLRGPKFYSNEQNRGGNQQGPYRTQVRSSFSRSLSGIPDALVCKCRTYASFDLASPSGAIGASYIKGNSLFDPFTNLSSSHESAFATQMRTNWNNYRVYAARVQVNVYPSFPATDFKSYTAMSMALGTQAGVSTGVSLVQIIESGRGVYNTFTTTNQSAAGDMWLKTGASTRSVLGVRKEELIGDPNFAGSCVGSDFADPATVWSFILAWQAADGATTTHVGADILMEQWVVFYGRRLGY